MFMFTFWFDYWHDRAMRIKQLNRYAWPGNMQFQLCQCVVIADKVNVIANAWNKRGVVACTYINTLSPVHTVAEKWDCRTKVRLSPKTAKFGDSRTFLRQNAIMESNRNVGHSADAQLNDGEFRRMLSQRMLTSSVATPENFSDIIIVMCVPVGLNSGGMDEWITFCKGWLLTWRQSFGELVTSPETEFSITSM